MEMDFKNKHPVSPICRFKIWVPKMATKLMYQKHLLAL